LRREGRPSPPENRVVVALLEKHDEQDDQHDQREQSDSDIHSYLLSAGQRENEERALMVALGLLEQRVPAPPPAS